MLCAATSQGTAPRAAARQVTLIDGMFHFITLHIGYLLDLSAFIATAKSELWRIVSDITQVDDHA